MHSWERSTPRSRRPAARSRERSRTACAHCVSHDLRGEGKAWQHAAPPLPRRRIACSMDYACLTLSRRVLKCRGFIRVLRRRCDRTHLARRERTKERARTRTAPSRRQRTLTPHHASACCEFKDLRGREARRGPRDLVHVERLVRVHAKAVLHGQLLDLKRGVPRQQPVEALAEGAVVAKD